MLLYLLFTCRPNDGFLRQLELYHAMGCRVDLSFPAYRKYRLDLLAEQMQQGISWSWEKVDSANFWRILAPSQDKIMKQL